MSSPLMKFFSAQTLEEEAAEDVFGTDEDEEDDDDGPNYEEDKRFPRSVEEKQAGKVS